MKAEDPSETAKAMLLACALRHRIMYPSPPPPPPFLQHMQQFHFCITHRSFQVLPLHRALDALDGVGCARVDAAGGAAAAVAPAAAFRFVKQK